MERLEDVVEEVEPDEEVPCPNCDGTIALWVGETELSDEEGNLIRSDCSIEAFVHIEPDNDE